VSSVEHQVPCKGRPVMLIDQGQIIVGLWEQLAAYSTSGQPLWTQPFKGGGQACMSLGFPGNVRQADDEGAH
jgi:hypothetical protein